MEHPTIDMASWLALKSETREALRTIFKIPKSRNVEVVNNRVVSDGTTPLDLRELTLEKLQKHLNSVSEDFYLLLKTAINRIENPELIEKKDAEVAAGTHAFSPKTEVVETAPEVPKKTRKTTKKTK